MATLAIKDGTQAAKTLKGRLDGADFIPAKDIERVGTGALDLGKAEDAPHASGDVGVAMLAVRTDATAARSGADGDYEVPQLKGGRLVVDADKVAVPTVVRNGKKTVTTATTREALAGTTAILSVVMIKALASNTGIVYVGDSTVAAANGYELAAGESVPLSVADLATIYLDVSVSGEGVSYVGS